MSPFWHDKSVFKSTLKPIIFLAIIFALLTLIWSTTFFIHSSEFWSIYVSKNMTNTDLSQVVLMKPLFHFFLYLFHLLPLNDVQHLIFVKFFFAIFGTIQLFLIVAILKNLTPEKRLISTESLCLILMGFTSIYFLQNFFRVRTDQICATLFLLFIYLNSKTKFTLKQHALFLILYPLIGLKGILFSILHSVQLAVNYKKEIFKTKYFLIIFLSFLSIIIWTIVLGWNSVTYLIYTTESFSTYFQSLLEWIQSDWILITFPLLSIFNSGYQIYTEKKLKINLSILSVASLILILLYPQKNNYFLASFIPILLLNTVSFLFYLIQDSFKKSKFKYAVTSFFVIFICTKLVFYYQTTPYRSNFEQIKFISTISNLIKSNHYNYVDGFGAMPRQNNMNCFVSPDDTISNQHCKNLITGGRPDVVIVTQRLLSLLQDYQSLNQQYTDHDFNVFINKNISDKVHKLQDIGPALMIFGFEI
jgi:hypothetical protein